MPQVSSLLKLYCREMPDPLCTYDLYAGFLRASKVPEEFRLGAMREMVMTLPKEHFRYWTSRQLSTVNVNTKLTSYVEGGLCQIDTICYISRRVGTNCVRNKIQAGHKD